MMADEHQQVIDELQVVTDRFEAFGMDKQMLEECDKLSAHSGRCRDPAMSV